MSRSWQTNTHTPSLFHSLTSNVSLLANTHTHTFIVSQLNSQCLAPGKHTGFQCFTITFNVSWQTHREAFIVSVFNIHCLTAGKHIDRLSLFQCLTHNVLLLQTPRLGLSQYTDTGLCHNSLTPGCHNTLTPHQQIHQGLGGVTTLAKATLKYCYVKTQLKTTLFLSPHGPNS